eukprot:449384-Amphidinium_carterae.1
MSLLFANLTKSPTAIIEELDDMSNQDGLLGKNCLSEVYLKTRAGTPTKECSLVSLYATSMAS